MEPQVGDIWSYGYVNKAKDPEYYLLLERIGLDEHGTDIFTCLHLLTGTVTERHMWTEFWTKVA